MRSSRLLSILLLLQSRGRMTATALAAAFEVSVRTVYRDVDQLSAAGVPVYADRGREGGFRLLDGYRTRLTGFTPAEAEAVLLAGLPGPADDLGLGAAVAAAQLKLLAALPEPRSEDAARVARRFHLDPVGWFRGTESKALLPLLAGAVWQERQVRIGYESWAGTVERILAPMGLVLKAGVWYLVALHGTAPRTYRVSAMRTLEVLADGFARPEGFDLGAYWTAWVREFETRIYQGEATLRLSPTGMRRLSSLAPAVAEMAARTASPPDAAGWVQARIPTESIDHAAGEMLKLGAEAEALAPPALRERMAGLALGLARMYGGAAR